MAGALTARSTIGEWLDDPVGGGLVRDLLASAGVGEKVLQPVRGLPLQQMVVMSQGRMPQSSVDDLVRRANGGVIPEFSDDEASGWSERITAGRFADRTVIVTGAGSGIGRATASRVAREGGRVIAVDLSESRLVEFAAEMTAWQVITVAGDITRAADVDAVVAAAGESIDGLANVAGINDDFSPLHETTDEMWERIIAVNLTGAFTLSRGVLPPMLSAGRGTIVNVSSEAGLRGSASGNAYTTSKHALIGMTRSAAFMYGPSGIRVNSVAPGGVATGMPMPAHLSAAGTTRLRPFQSAIPSVATAEQVAAAITFLLSDDSVNINGAILPSDGGWSVQ